MRKSILFFVMTALFFLAVSGFAQPSQDQLKQIRSTVIEKTNGQEFYIHTVKRGQTLYMISKAYGVDINEVIKENPQVKEGIKADQKIRIPIGKPKPASVQPASEPVPEKKTASSPPKPLPESKPLTVKKDTLIRDTATKKAVYKVAFMLPLYLDEVDAIDPEVLASKPDAAYKSLQFIQFYEGFRMALDSLGKMGMKLKLYVYDVSKDTVKTKQMLAKPELKNMDLIVGVLYHRNFQIVAEFAERNNINIVNPITERSELLKGNSRVFKVRPSRTSQVSQLAKYLEKLYPQSRILILKEGVYKDKETVDLLKKECSQRKLNVSIVEGLNATINSFTKDKENVVVAFSTNNNYILELTRRMYELRNDYPLTLVGMPAWDKNEGLETEYMVGLHAHIMVPYFIDYQNTEVRKFVGKFQELYKTDPDQLAFLGHDVALYFMSVLWKSGRDFQTQLPVSKPYLQTAFDFKAVPGSGYENQHWEIYKYENYRLIKVN